MESQESRWIFSVEIDHMTVDLFRYWLKRDWPTIAGKLHVLDAKETAPSLYEGDWFVIWSDDSPHSLGRISTINWAQLSTEKLIVEWIGIDTLSAQIQAWLESRFGLAIDTVKKN